MEKGKIQLTQKDAENTPAGGVVVGKRDGQTMIYDDASLGGYFVGKLHKDGGIKMVNKSTGQPLEVQGAEVIITAPAVNDQTKREFDGKMMTNREILSKINSDGGGVSFADGGDIPAKINTTDCEYKFGGKVVKDTDIAHSLGMNSTLKKGKQQFSSGDTTYDVDAIYNAIKKGKLRLKTKEVETFPMKYPVYDKKYSETVKTDFRKPNGITVRTESGEEVLIDGNHRMNNAYLKGRKTMKTYYVEDPKQIAKFTKKNKFELGGENKMGGHLSSGKSLKQIAEMHNVSLAHINEQLAKGLEVEKEHFTDFKERTRVAKDHLVENPNYYTILEKAGLKDGGHLIHHRHINNLVKDAKSGNTPARDLNNYNDVMDLEADGMVGMESGLAFANGGQVSNFFKKTYGNLVEKQGIITTKTDWFNKDGVKVLQYGFDPYRYEKGNTLFFYSWDYDDSGMDYDEFKEQLVDFFKKTYKKDVSELKALYVGWDRKEKDTYANGGIFPRVNHSDKLGKEFVYQGGKFLIVDFPNKQGAWNKGARFRGNTASHHTYLIKLDEVETDMDKNLFMKFEIPYFYNNDLDYWENFVGLPSVNSKGTVSKFLEDRFFNFFPKDTKLADGGITPIDANIEGDSVDIVENDFAKGGVVYDTTKPKIEKITIKDTKFNRTSVIGRNASTVSEFQQIVSDYIGNTPKEDVDWISFYVNDSTRGSYYIDLNKGKKNTVKNVNPETLNSLNFRRVIDAKTYLVKNYDWTDFFELGSQKSAFINKKENSPDLVRLQYSLQGNKISRSFRTGDDLLKEFFKIEEYCVKNPDESVTIKINAEVVDSTGRINDTERNVTFGEKHFKPRNWTNGGIENLMTKDWFSDKLDFTDFFKSTSNTSTSSKTPLTKEELFNSRIWIGDNVELRDKVIAKLEEIGIPFDKYSGNAVADESIDINIFSNDFVVYKESKEEFDKDTKRKEIFLEDLGIDVTTMGVASTTANASTSAKPFDFSMTKIDVMDNVDLSIRVQQKAFEDGWEWENGGGKNTKNDPFNYMYFTKTSISFGNTTSSFDNSPKREITEAEIFGSQATASQTPTSSQVVERIEVKYLDKDGNTIRSSLTYDANELYEKLADLRQNGFGDVSVTPLGKNVISKSKYIPISNNIWEYNLYTLNKDEGSLYTMNNISADFPDLDFSKFRVLKSLNPATQNEPFDFSDTKIWIGDNPELSTRVQEKAIESGYKWAGLDPFVQNTERKDLYFNGVNKSINHGGSDRKDFDAVTVFREITEQDIFGKQQATISNEVTHINLRYEKNGTPTYYSGLAGGKEFIEAINSIEQANPIQEVSVNVAVSYKADNRIGGSTTEKLVENINFGKGAFQPSNFTVSEIKSIVANDWFNGKLDFNDFFRDIVSTVLTSTIPTSNSVVPKIVETEVYDLSSAVNKLEKASSSVVTEYNKEIYDKTLKFLYDTKATYELALKFTPESAFMYERLDILKKLADIEKKIKNIEDMKKGGTFYMLAKILEKLERGENWKMLEQSQDVITNQIPQSEIDVIIRSQKFKNWFGDWEKALINDEYDNVSKALTEGIPTVYHHGARRIKYTYREVSNGVLYLAENISYAVWFSQNATAQSEEGNYLTECFVNIKNPIDLTAFKVNKVDLGDIVRYVDAVYPMAKIYDFIPAQVALLIKTNQPTNVRMWAWQLIRSYAKFVNHIKENTPYDGFLYYENNPSDEVVNPATGQLEENVTKAVAIFKSHQVKVVDAVLFDGGLDDWRFENGGKIKN
jgi:hypothetical protein